MSYLVGFLAALVVGTVTTVIGKIIGLPLAFLAGWWGCMAYNAACRWFDRTYSRKPA